MKSNPEQARLKQSIDNKGWKTWGPYLSERQWGTVREDYSPYGTAWDSFTHDMARSRAYRWGEDGIGGISDSRQTLCFAMGMWNGKDRIIKERLFGVSGVEGNHGEDVKEAYYYLDSTPTHSYMKMLYKYPQNEYPYTELVSENRKRTKLNPEYEIWDTGLFDQNEYFDIYIEYAKVEENDILIKVTACNRSSEVRQLNLLPTIWFRNTWSWGYPDFKHVPSIIGKDPKRLNIFHKSLGNFYLYYGGNPELLFCENVTNNERIFNKKNTTPYPKDSINNYIITGDRDFVNPQMEGTKTSLNYLVNVEAGGSETITLRLTNKDLNEGLNEFHELFNLRQTEADLFYESLLHEIKDEELKMIQRQAYAGMLWSKQFYYYNVVEWLNGNPSEPPPPESRKYGRNHDWKHLVNGNILSMPDKWEFPWYAAWDLAFHCVPLARLDPMFAKRQLILMLREYYMHPNGQIPAYEWNFSDVNPPVHAWGAWKVYQIEKEANDGVGDTDFLEKVYHKLLMNFTWWVNQKDAGGNNLFEGGFLGLDNIGVFDRGQTLPTGGSMEQADGTAWMAMYSLNMLRISLELSKKKPYYQESASKFFNHFLAIAGALANISEDHLDLWDNEDEFFYDVLHVPDQHSMRLKVRSMVGLIPMFAVEVLTPDLLSQLPDFTRRLDYVIKNRPELASLISRWYEPGKGETRLLSLLRGHRMKCLLKKMLDEAEFLSEYGIRALSKYHLNNPYEYTVGDTVFTVQYCPAESDSNLFGGNSNWRGPIWFPVNYLIIESLRKFHDYYGEDFKVEHPTGSGNMHTLKEISEDLSARLMKIFSRDEHGRRAVFGKFEKLQNDPHFKDNILFFEYFNGDTGAGLGASHQTGWSGLISDIIAQSDYKKFWIRNEEMSNTQG
ncbi:MAG TPA: glucosidase [Cytophagales bacterium]|nr:glucosidase [Cytophagales bacterium]